MSETTLAQLIERARTDTDFKQRVLRDLDGTLTAEEYRLSGDELEAARQLHQQAQGMSEEEIDAALNDDMIGHRGG